MNKRPTSVTVVAWYLIISSVLTLFSLASNSSDPVVREIMARNLFSIRFQQAMIFITLVATLLSGVGALQGCHWGRVLFVVSNLLSLAIGIVGSPMKWMVIPSLAIVAFLAYFLFSTKANAFFKSATGDNARPT